MYLAAGDTSSNRPPVDVGGLVDSLTLHVLRMFGVDDDEARRLVALPLPEYHADLSPLSESDNATT